MVTASGTVEKPVHNGFVSLSSNRTNVFVGGKTQAGKSSVIRKLTKNDVRVGEGTVSCTSEVTPYLCVDDDEVVLVDSPGLCDSGGGEEEEKIYKKIAEFMQNQTVSLFCFVVQQGVFDSTVQQTVRRIEYMLGQEN